jgi:hypothetical protein
MFFSQKQLGNLLRRSHSIPSELLDLIHRLSQDPCHGVQSYLHVSSNNDPSLANDTESRKRRLRISTFSRPPPPKDQTEDSSIVSPLSHRINSDCEPSCNGSTSATQTPNMGVFPPPPSPPPPSPSPTLTPKEEIRRANDMVTVPEKIFIT